MGLNAALKTKILNDLATNAKGKIMLGFIVASIDKKTMRKVTKVDQECIKYTSVISQGANFVEDEFKIEFPEHQFIIAMPIEDLKKQISFIEKLI